ncbi:unnamed protein product [Spirodela intermedia]|uniref:ELMO domain-containing protein n=1 Tax=Spirodela intermedia TaxID=51605 RepID=A0A7I8IPW1_SPIIN|nr:unnamed protein product [Spirodela intermedia]CAA6659920.1 unnamed protein product [Spirodela intermedia]
MQRNIKSVPDRRHPHIFLPLSPEGWGQRWRENEITHLIDAKVWYLYWTYITQMNQTHTWPIQQSLSCVCIKRKGAYERIWGNLTPLQEERLKRLRQRTQVSFDSSRRDHQEALKSLWYATYPDQELHGLISDQWKEMGWQGRDPSTDFRLILSFISGAGFISLENLLFFAKTFSVSFQRLLNKAGGKRATWEYPFAVAGVNITFMIMQMLQLHSCRLSYPSFLEDEWAFDVLYCVAFMVMDKQWLEKNASYMEFNDVLKSTRAQLERELLLDDVLRIEDMPSFSLLS